MSGLPEEAARTLKALLCLQLKLSYLFSKTPKALKEYTDSRVSKISRLARLNCFLALHSHLFSPLLTC